MLVRIGQSKLQGDVVAYARQFDLVELRAEPGTLPRPGKLRELAARAPEGFTFSVVLARCVAGLETDGDASRAETYGLQVAEAVGATWLVLQTPSAVAPTSRTRRRLGELTQRLTAGEARVAWEPAGVWEDREAEALAAELGVHLVRDLARREPPPGAVVYARLRALGSGDRLGAAAAERVALRLVGFDEAVVVIEARDAGQGAKVIRATLADLADDDQEP